MKKSYRNGLIVACLAVVAIAIGVWVARDGGGTPYDYDLSKYIKVENYKGLSYTEQQASVTDEEVETAIQEQLSQYATTETATEGVVEDGDTVNITFVGTINGETFDGGSGDMDLTIGVTSMIDGFSEGIIGHSVGETFTEDLQFPDSYPQNTDLEGKPVTFTITINSLQVINLPELTDAYVQETFDCDTVEAYQEKTRARLERQAQDAVDYQAMDELWQQLFANAEVLQYPEKELETARKTVDKQEEQMKQQAESYGMEWADYLSVAMGTDEAGFADMKEQMAKDLVKEEMIVYYIARQEGVELSDDDYKAELTQILEDNNLTEETFQKQFNMTIEAFAETNNWHYQIFRTHVMRKVMEFGTATAPEEAVDATEGDDAEEMQTDGEEIVEEP